MHSDMVGYEIEDQAEIVLLQRCAEPFEAGFAPKLRIEFCVIDDVIAMRQPLRACMKGDA